MGQRANLLIVTGGSYEMYYTHHRANTLDHDLFWGPDYALGFIRAQRRVDPSEWLDDVWAEGGAVMDLDRRVLLWFGGEDVRYDVPLRREHARLVGRLWPGWTVRWADGGIVDLADYVGVQRAEVLSEKKEPAAKVLAVADALRADRPDWSDTLGSIRFGPGDVRANRLIVRCQQILFTGAEIVPAALAAAWPTDLSADWSGDGRQLGGFHIDVPEQAVDFWTADPMGSADVERRVRDRWSGWRVTWHGSRFESQLERVDGHVRVVLPTRERLVEQLRQSLLRPDDDGRQSGAETILSVATAMTQQTGQRVTDINPAALFDARLLVPLAVRTRLFDAAIAGTTGEQA